MRVLFAHDGPIYKDEEGNFFEINALKERYLYLGEEVTYLIRVDEISNQDAGKYTKISKNNFLLKEIPNFKSFRLFFKNKKLAEKKVEEAIRDNDIIMARLPSSIGALAVKYAKKYNKPLLTEVVACNWDVFYNHSATGKLLSPFFYLKQKNILNNVEYAIYVTEKFLQKRYPNKGQSINCSNVELVKFEAGILEQRLKKIENVCLGDTIKIATIAAVNVKYKGQEYVIKALSKLKEVGYKYKYYVVGQGDPSRLRKLVKKLGLEEEVKFTGPLPHEKIFNFLDDMDLYIQPSKTEGLPRALIEAMSRGCPALGSEAGGIPELLEKEYIFHTGNINKLAEKIKEFGKLKMKQQAVLNFNTSKEYHKNFLLIRRLSFYKKFLNENKLPVPEILEKVLANKV